MAIRRALLVLRIGCFFVFTVATAIFAWAFYTRYYAWLDCFNELGRCYDPDGSGDVYTTSGFAWAIPALVSLALAVASWALIRKR